MHPDSLQEMGVKFERRIADLEEQKEELDSTRDELQSTQDALEDAQIEAELNATTMHVMEQQAKTLTGKLTSLVNLREIFHFQILSIHQSHISTMPLRCN